MIAGDAITPLATDRDGSVPVEDDSETIQQSPRRALIDALTRAVSDGAEIGDLALAQFAAESLVSVLPTAGGPDTGSGCEEEAGAW